MPSPQQCVGAAVHALDKAADLANMNPDAANALVRVADGWRQLAGDIARTPGMQPAPTGDR